MGSFYKYANKTFSCKQQIGPLLDENGCITNDPKKKADSFAKFFSSVFTKDNGLGLQDGETVAARIYDVQFTPGLVRRVINRLKK